MAVSSRSRPSSPIVTRPRTKQTQGAFLAYEDLYDDTEIIDAGAGGEYWIRIKTSLTHDEKERADKHLHKVQGTLDDRGKMRSVVAPDLENYQRAMVTNSIVAWNLDEDDGSLWQLSPDSAKARNIGRLPSSVFSRVYDRVQELNQEDHQADKQFRSPVVGGDSDGDIGATDTPAIFDGNETVDSPRYPSTAVVSPSVA